MNRYVVPASFFFYARLKNLGRRPFGWGFDERLWLHR